MTKIKWNSSHRSNSTILKGCKFGLAIATTTFQSIMVNLFRKELMQAVICYLDDIVIYSHIIDGHFHTIEIVFRIFQSVNLRLKTEKCSFFTNQLDF